MKLRFDTSILVIIGLAAPAWGAGCESLSSVSLRDTTITFAGVVPAGSFTPPGAPAPLANLPAFCRVAGEIRPNSDSTVQFETWLPLDAWNGRFQGVGNLGISGQIPYATPFFSMASALAAGYATGGTDSGHAGPIFGNGDWAIGHPEKVTDLGHRGVHLMTVASKAIVEALYGKPSQYSYFNGCSQGGAQGLAEAQRYPLDYDGILAVSPANYFSHLTTLGLWFANAIHKDAATAIPDSLLPFIHDSVLRACDRADGLADGVLEDPRACDFNLASLRCGGANTAGCLTDAQISGIRAVYSGPVNPVTGEQIYSGVEPGSELAWQGWISGTAEPFNFIQFGFSLSTYAGMVFEQPDWDWTRFDFNRDVAFGAGKLASSMDRTNPDLRAFRSLGRKLLQVHGWSDQATTPRGSIAYYHSVAAAFTSYAADGGKTPADVTDFYRLFMVPGMYHCAGGPGTDTFDGLAALRAWVETGTVPDRILAAHFTNGAPDKTRPLCPYPQVARHRGSGDPNDAASFICVNPPPH